MKSLIHTGASLALKVAYEGGTEKLIGFCRNFTYTVNQGQKQTFVVDSSVPAEIAQGAAPSFVRGSFVIYLPKGTNPEALGLVSYRVAADGSLISQTSKYMHFRIYDRMTGNLQFACEYCKVSSYTVVQQARGIIEVSLQFDGMMGTPGLVT